MNDPAMELDRLRLALQSAHVGTWILDIHRQQVWWDDQCKKLYGFRQDDTVPYDQVLSYMHEQDRSRIEAAVSWALDPQSAGHYDVRFRTVGAEDGQVRWLHCQGKADFDDHGVAYRFSGIAQEVTEEIAAQRQLENQEATLRLIIELAQLGTCEVDLIKGQSRMSPRFADWFGHDQLVMPNELVYQPVNASDRKRLDYLLDRVLQGSQAQSHTIEYGIVNAKTGQQRILQATILPHFDVAGRPTKLTRVVRDMTEAHYLQLALEDQIKVRTQALTTTNKQLASRNEELAISNAELAEANSLLVRSNDNLQQFAYVASHDLQEPLRKIQQFGDLLKTRLADRLDGEELTYLDRVQKAASRMATLIKDLLSFSRISTQRSPDEPVALAVILDHVLGVFDWHITQTKAQIQVGKLPIVAGDARQLEQLFQNLVGNALKFQRATTTPIIHICADLLSIDQLPPDVKPTRQASTYHCIEVADNGIGFEEKYLDRIFQVFQRLHSKNQYSGTGIGLAICEKVVTNHGGVITARSQPGQGATFVVYLPAGQ